MKKEKYIVFCNIASSSALELIFMFLMKHELILIRNIPDICIQM